MNFEKLIGKRFLICGEVGAGKTRLLTGFLKFLVNMGLRSEVTVIDLAPECGDIGISVESYYPETRRLKYMRPSKIYPPRLLGRSCEDILRYAEMNLIEAKKLLKNYLQAPSRILLINDLTIYLHAGDPDEMLYLLNFCETFAATAYEGEILEDDRGSGITMRERRGLSKIKEHMDLIINL